MPTVFKLEDLSR
uniref:Uncharacterized protein n=1 Tax=Romanomermis culicivorax TaxID=13658 RepID=A0A915HVA2_ROMCU